MNSRWSDELRERMAEYEAPAPEALFEQIMEAMPASQPAKVVPLGGWRRWTAVAAVVAVMAGGYLLLDKPMQPEEELLAEVENISMPILSEVEEKAEPIALEEKPAPRIAQRVIQKKHNPEGSAELQTIEKEVMETEELNDEAPQPPTPKTTPSATQKQERKSTQNNNYYAMMQQPKRFESAGRLSANIFASGSSAGHSMHGLQQVFHVNSSLFGEEESNSMMAGVSGGDMLLYNSDDVVQTDIHHSQPVRFGFTLRYQISERWGVESGLVYSLLNSRSELGHKSNYSTDRQSLHYLGLPVSGVYNLWSNRRFVVYLSAGAMVEKCVSGSLKTTYTINGKNEKSQRTDLMVDELQLSVMASAGAQVNLSPLVGLYVEPGVGYWFDNGSAVQTIYGEQPFNFNLNLGLRFTIK